MKKIFPGHYTPNDAYFQNLGENATIVLDTNVLLHLLRLGDKAREEVLDVLDKLKDRLWIPHQVALEFSRNWRTIERDNASILKSVEQEITESKEKCISAFKKIKRHDVLDFAALENQLNSAYANITSIFHESKNKFPSSNSINTIVDKLCDIFDEKIGTPYNKEDLTRIYKEGEDRYQKDIPPGYKDKSKAGDGKYGDLILWKQILEYSKTKNKDIILISEDNKEDWFSSVSGKTTGPHPELINEFHSETNQTFYLYQLSSFLQRFSANQETQISAETLKAIDHLNDVDLHKSLWKTYTDRLLDNPILRHTCDDDKDLMNRLWWGHTDNILKKDRPIRQVLVKFARSTETITSQLTILEDELNAILSIFGNKIIYTSYLEEINSAIHYTSEDLSDESIELINSILSRKAYISEHSFI